MHRTLVRLWLLPWPPWLRRLGERIMHLPGVRLLIFPQWQAGVAAIIENEAGEILLLRHTYRPGRAWGLPSGFIEHHEQPEGAIRREIREETGLEVQLTGILTVETDWRRPTLTIIYRARMSGGQFVPSAEVSEVRFFPRSGLPRDMVVEQRRTIEQWA